jgi:hypothetical protein
VLDSLGAAILFRHETFPAPIPVPRDRSVRFDARGTPGAVRPDAVRVGKPHADICINASTGHGQFLEEVHAFRDNLAPISGRRRGAFQVVVNKTLLGPASTAENCASIPGVRSRSPSLSLVTSPNQTSVRAGWLWFADGWPRPSHTRSISLNSMAAFPNDPS